MVRRMHKWAAGLAAALVVAGIAGPARADDAAGEVDSPRYASWAKVKPGTSVTMVADQEINTVTVHIELTRTLVSVTADAATISISTKVTAMGHEQPAQTRSETIPAKQSKDAATDAGTADVEAMGKTFPCKVYEVTGLMPGGGGGGPPGAPAATGGKVKLYMNADVPGGAVKIESPGPMGKPIVFILTATDVK